MNATIDKEIELQSDSSLVERSLAGERDAFGQLVARYQSPICALAYSACGDISRSEDTAQEVFLAAWQRLGSLREADKFKSWLFGIARNLINNAFRQNARNPLAAADTLDDAQSDVTAHKPDDLAISREEQTLMWQVLSSLPQVFREPMILFYRQNESIERVADVLEISEEAVRQRLSRGRALLNERVAGVVRNGLRRSAPADVFTAAVIASITALAAATTTKGAVMGVAVAEGAKAPVGTAAALKTIGMVAAVWSIPAAVGAFFGHLLTRDENGNPQRRKSAALFWRVFGIGIALLGLLPLLTTFAVAPFLSHDARRPFLDIVTYWLGLAYPFVLVSLAYWIWLRSRRASDAAAVPLTPALDSPMSASQVAKIARKPLRRLVLIMTLVATGLLVFCIHDSNLKFGRLASTDQLGQILDQNPAGAVKIFMMGSADHHYFDVKVSNAGKSEMYVAPADSSFVAFLAQRGISYPTYVRGVDYEILGWPGRLLPFLTVFVLGLGAAFLIKRRPTAVAGGI